jgi:DNA-binding CsgD family transcriptional regulator
MMLAVVRGREPQAQALIDAVRNEASALGQGSSIHLISWMSGLLCNGLGRFEEALGATQEPDDDHPDELPHVSAAFAAVESVEAAVRSHAPARARNALARVEAATACARTDSALGILARSRALVAEGAAAERLYQEAIDRLGRSRLRPDLARAHLLYGEWLRQEGRRADARLQLRAAHEQFSAIGMEAFTARAARELLLVGEDARKVSEETRPELTSQEMQIARLARDGLSNPEIGAQLFLSPRTVEWHLRKVFTKLGITSRRELRAALPMESWLVAGG